jgi:hypothetical protein
MTVKVLMSCGQRRWVPLVGITGYVSYAPALMVRQLGGMQFVPRTMGIAQFFGLFKDPIEQEVLEIIKQDWKHLVLVEIEGFKGSKCKRKICKMERLSCFSHALCRGQISPNYRRVC